MKKMFFLLIDHINVVLSRGSPCTIGLNLKKLKELE